jgi:hypothetical protein
MTMTQAELIVLDTGLSRAPTKLFEVDRLIEPRNAVDYDMIFVPTRQAVLELAGQFGFETVPLAQNMTDYTSMEDYRRGERLAFVCSNGVSLSKLQVEPRAPVNAWLASVDRAARRVRQRFQG